jgi:hypothetical protein
VPEYKNTVPPWLPLAALVPRSAHPRRETFLVPAVTINWWLVEIVAQGSSTVAFAVEIVTFDPIDNVPLKFRASHVPPFVELNPLTHALTFAPKSAPANWSA